MHTDCLLVVSTCVNFGAVTSITVCNIAAASGWRVWWVGVSLRFRFHRVYLSLILILKQNNREASHCLCPGTETIWLAVRKHSGSARGYLTLPPPLLPTAPASIPPWSLHPHLQAFAQVAPLQAFPALPLLPGQGLLSRGPAPRAPLSTPHLGKPDSPLVGPEAPP